MPSGVYERKVNLEERERKRLIRVQRGRDRVKARRLRMRDELNRQQREWRITDPERMRAYGRKWYYKNKELLCVYRNLPHVKIARSLRGRIRDFLGVKKSRESRFSRLLGCTAKELRNHLERQFKPWMTWENYGTMWHIDHILPCSTFDLTDPRQQEICFHFTNLQPLKSRLNLKKHAKILQPQMHLRLKV